MVNNSAFIGIDFGTTNSKMAWFDPDSGKDGRAEILRNAEGEEKMPSAVYFGELETLVGTPAENELDNIKSAEGELRSDEMMRFIRSIKRNLINPPIIALPGGKDIRPVEVVAEVLRKLKRDAEERHFQEEIRRAVITYPAVFDTKQQAVIRAGATLAGFGETVLLEEPVAAALAFGNTGQKVGNGVLVYDLGGGTFDLALIVRDADGTFRLAMETDGDANCGGDDFDQVLYDYWDDQIKRDEGIPFSFKDGAVNPSFLKQCRQRKENLSVTHKSQFKSFLPNGKSVAVSMERATFEGLIGDRIDETVRKVKRTLDRAAEARYDVDTVLLIGGSSEIPLVRQRLTETLNFVPQKWQYRDLAVALGAAYYGNQIWNFRKPAKKRITPVVVPPKAHEIPNPSVRPGGSKILNPKSTGLIGANIGSTTAQPGAGNLAASKNDLAEQYKTAKGRRDIIGQPVVTGAIAQAPTPSVAQISTDINPVAVKPAIGTAPTSVEGTTQPKPRQGGCAGPLFILVMIALLIYFLGHSSC